MIQIDEKICTGCRTCEFACAFQQKGTFHDGHSLIRIQKDKREEGFFLVTACRHCPSAPCIPACPAEAIKKDSRSGMVRIDRGRCTGCGECVGACPYSAPLLNSNEGVAQICDLCQGDPLCIKFCQPGALRSA